MTLKKNVSKTLLLLTIIMDEKLFKQKTGMDLSYYIKQYKTRNVFYIQKFKIKPQNLKI